MTEQQHYISIWFFIGSLLFVYGILITASGLYGLFTSPAPQVQLDYLRLWAPICWGPLLVILGGFYSFHFFPGRRQSL